MEAARQAALSCKLLEVVGNRHELLQLTVLLLSSGACHTVLSGHSGQLCWLVINSGTASSQAGSQYCNTRSVESVRCPVYRDVAQFHEETAIWTVMTE